MNDRHDHADTSPDEARRRHRDEAEAAPPTQWSEDAGTRKAPESQRDRRSDARSSPGQGTTPPEPGHGEAAADASEARRKRRPACPGRRSSWRSPRRGASRVGRLRTLATEFAGGADPGPDQSVRFHGPHGRGETRGQPDRNTPARPVGSLQTANIFARATGYIAERRVDIGSRVKKGDLLVHIAAPDLDEQVAQAKRSSARSRPP